MHAAIVNRHVEFARIHHCLLYTSDAADERSSVDLGGRRIIKKKNNINLTLDGTNQTEKKSS